MDSQPDSGDVHAADPIRLTPEIVADMDSRHESPQQVAERVWAAIQESTEKFTRMEMSVFCSEFLGQIAIGQFPHRTEFRSNVVGVAQFLYAGHYAQLIAKEREAEDVPQRREQLLENSATCTVESAVESWIEDNAGGC